MIRAIVDYSNPNSQKWFSDSEDDFVKNSRGYVLLDGGLNIHHWTIDELKQCFIAISPDSPWELCPRNVLHAAIENRIFCWVIICNETYYVGPVDSAPSEYSCTVEWFKRKYPNFRIANIDRYTKVQHKDEDR